MSKRRLQGLRVAVLAVDGFEQVEVTIPMRALRREGADVRIVSLRPGRIRGMNFLFRGKKLPVDDIVSRARPEEYGALLLLRSLGAKRLSVGLLGAAAVVAGAARILVPRGGNTRRMGLAPDALRSAAAA